MAHGCPFKDLRPSLLALFLDSELKSLRDVGPNKVWDRRLSVLLQADGDVPATVANTVLPGDGTHFRSSQLQLICKVLGIRRRPARKWKHLQRIDEIVGHRHAITHGRDTAESIGRRYSMADIYHRIRQIQSVCLHFTEIVEEHCSDTTRFCR